MKFERTQTFINEWRQLSDAERDLAKPAFRTFVQACNEAEAAGRQPEFPPALRVKVVSGAPGIMEMTWNVRRPDGRATWQWVTIDGTPAVRWRRVGGHDVFRDA